MTSNKLNKLCYEFTYSKNENVEFLIASDIHFDNPKCKRELFFSHLDRIRKKGGKAYIIGDLFCFMQGKYDPRRAKGDIREEHNKNNYIDAVIDDTVNILSAYADVIVFVSDGNHETAILKNLETDTLERFVNKFNERNKTSVIKGGYRGWIIIRKETAKNEFVSHKIYYHHGYGGGGEMTKGILQHSRMNMHIEGADAIVMGHVHESYVQVGKTAYFDNNPNAYCEKDRVVWNIRSACYKEEFADTNGGFHIERGRPPKPLGGVYASLDVERNEKRTKKLLADYTIWAQ